MRYLIAAALCLLAFGSPWLAANHADDIRSLVRSAAEAGQNLAAAAGFRATRTVAELEQAYAAAPYSSQGKIRVLIVPGHEPAYGGSEYGRGGETIMERDLNAQLAVYIAELLEADSHYEVFMARDAGSWDPALSSYFETERDEISSWARGLRAQEAALKSSGQISTRAPAVMHNQASPEAAHKLFGIHRWANENDVDVAIHVHFNDHADRGAGEGRYRGFAVYVPDRQYGNHETTLAAAGAVTERLKAFNPVSDLPGEKTGIVEDQELIAVGVAGSSEAASMLIEYSYIYEPQVVDREARPLFLRDLAYQTYLGLQDFFSPPSETALSVQPGTLLVPHRWSAPMGPSEGTVADILSLQTALILSGIYPPEGKTMNECPRTGKFGGCTRAAVSAFQERYGIAGEKGVVGPRTLERLNADYSSRPI